MLSMCFLSGAMRSAFFFVTVSFAVGQNSSKATCQCPLTSGRRQSCCSDGGNGGEGSGNFCGNLFQKTYCNSDTPVCCNSNVRASCGPVGSSCTPGCILGLKDGSMDCTFIPPPAPSPASKAYDVKWATAIATLAIGAGCGPTDIFKNFKCKACRDIGFDIAPGTMRFVTHDDLGTHNATFAYIARLQPVGNRTKDSDYGCVIGNRGSTSLVNYVEDAEFWRQEPTIVPDCDGCLVEHGFYHAWADLENKVLVALEELGCTPDGPHDKVLVTGHSMGAAASIVAMRSLKVKGFDVQQSVVFELPRVGNEAFARDFANQFEKDFDFVSAYPVFVVTHAMDPVVHLPPTDIPGLAYQHVNAPEVYYFPSYDIEQYIVCQGPEDPACSARYALLDTIASGEDHCRPFFLSPNVNPQGVPDFCYYPAEFCNGGASMVIV